MLCSDIKGYEGLYSIDSEGKVFSYRSNRYLKNQTFSGKQYEYVVLSKDGVTEKKRIHRLVAETFLPNPNNLPEVNHKDENPHNNNLDNLEWISRADNINYGTRNKRTGEKMIGNKNQKKAPVSQFSLEGEFIQDWYGAKEAATSLGICASGITRCCKGDYKQSGGYIWRYKEELS